MPIYDYHCKECDHSFEERKSMADREIPLVEPCPSCKKPGNVEQVVGSPAFIDPVRLGIKKAPADFQKYVLGRIQSCVPHNVIGKKTSLVREV